MSNNSGVMVPKKYSDCYLYKANVYEPNLVMYINKADIIDKNDEKFFGIMNTFKASYPKWLYKFINSDSLLFLIPNKSVKVNKAFNGFAISKKNKDNGIKNKIAIVNGYLLDVHMKSNKYVLSSSHESVMMGYILNSFVSYIYLLNPRLLARNTKIITMGSEIYAKLFNHVLHYMYKINVNTKLKNEVEYMVKMYYFVNLLNFKTDVAMKYAEKNTKLSKMEINLLNADDEYLYKDIDKFINNVLSKMSTMEDLTLSKFLEKWVQLYGAGTEFALELLPAFIGMLTTVYVSSYSININTIQNIIGKTNIIGAEIMNIGGRLYG